MLQIVEINQVFQQLLLIFSLGSFQFFGAGLVFIHLIIKPFDRFVLF